MSILLIVLPFLVFLIGVLGLYSQFNFIQPFETIVKVQYIVAIYALIYLGLLFYFKTIIKNSKLIDEWIWGTVAILVIGSIFFILLRISADRQRATIIGRVTTYGSKVGDTLYNIGSYVGGAATGLAFKGLDLGIRGAQGLGTLASELYSVPENLGTLLR